MNILFFIGNGFDLNIGMKTSYSDFYEYYKNVFSNVASINRLKREISKNIVHWSDLELELGAYTEQINSVQEFDEVYDDIGGRLSEYLQKEEKKFDFNKLDKKKFLDHLSFPENVLPQADKNRLSSFRRNWKGYVWNVRIITFNYTTTLEKLIGDKRANLQIGSHNPNAIILQGLEHIHGFTKERMVMGVNDVTQIKNTEFQKNQDVLEALVKSTCNQAYRHTIDDLCKRHISESNLICIFGSSIGDTDILWWKLIAEQLKQNCLLINFIKGENIDPRIEFKKMRKEREIKDLFLEKVKLSKEDRQKISDKIIIGYNTNLFKI
jgi:hypothetical protein